MGRMARMLMFAAPGSRECSGPVSHISKAIVNSSLCTLRQWSSFSQGHGMGAGSGPDAKQLAVGSAEDADIKWCSLKTAFLLAITMAR